jgi:hypothetical protein
MPHISDGDLHAWLDGAIPEDSGELRALRVHLESCTDCASRIEDARRLRGDAESILASALPEGAAPSFEEIERKALDEGRAPGAAMAGAGRLRTGWLNVQRLGWAASVMLALGAGWIGRAVLVEKGWTDPFNEGPAPAVSRAADPKSDEQTPADYFARDMDAVSEVGGEAPRMDQPEEANEALEELDVAAKAPLKAEGAAAREVRERGGRERQEAEAGADDAAELPSRTGALAQTESPDAETPSLADEAGEPSTPAARKDLEAKSIQPPVDPWHDLPPGRDEAPAETSLGCYRLEFSWSPGLAYLPGTIELTAAESESWSGGSIYSVGLPGRVTLHYHEAIWASLGSDSVWVRLVSGTERDMFTVRAERKGRDWEGEGRVFSPAAPVSTGQTRGTVRLLRIRCEPK